MRVSSATRYVACSAASACSTRRSSTGCSIGRESDPAEVGRRGRGDDHGGHPRDAACVPGRVRHVLPRGLAARGRPVAGRDRLERLREAGHTYESEGALWLRTTEFGDDKDRVLRRSTGAPTYFAADVAYQEDKFRAASTGDLRPGADHHGYIARLKAIAARWARTPTASRCRSCSSCTSSRAASRRMSKRRGRLRDADELIERSASTRRAGSCSPLARLHDRPGPRPRAKQDPRTPSTTCR